MHYQQCPICYYVIRVTDEGVFAVHADPRRADKRACPGSGRRPD